MALCASSLLALHKKAICPDVSRLPSVVLGDVRRRLPSHSRSLVAEQLTLSLSEEFVQPATFSLKADDTLKSLSLHNLVTNGVNKSIRSLSLSPLAEGEE